MANTYTQVFIHAVFTVQGRRNLIQADFWMELLNEFATVYRPDPTRWIEWKTRRKKQ